MWKHKNFINLQLCATFKHFYDAGTIGSGTVKFRHYSQTEPARTITLTNWTSLGASDVIVTGGTFTGTPSLGEDNALTMTVGQKGYAVIQPDITALQAVTSEFGITQTNKGNAITASYELFFPWGGRLTTTAGTDGGVAAKIDFTINALSGYALDEILLVKYNSIDDTAEVLEPDEFNSEYGRITLATRLNLSFNDIIVVYVKAPETVIKAGTYEWVDTPDIQGIVDIVGSDGGYDGNFESSGISFNGIYFRVGGGNTEIAYSPIENFSSLVDNNEVDFVGYTNDAWKIIHSAGEYADIPSLQTFTVLENINLEIWGKDAAEQILTWFTANTTKLS